MSNAPNRGYTWTCCKTLIFNRTTSPDIDLFSYFVASYACLSADHVELKCVECCRSCSHPGIAYVPVSHRRVDFFKIKVSLNVLWRVSPTHRFCRPGGISATRRGVGISGNGGTEPGAERTSQSWNVWVYSAGKMKSMRAKRRRGNCFGRSRQNISEELQFLTFQLGTKGIRGRSSAPQPFSLNCLSFKK